MKRQNLIKLHAACAALGLLVILTFWISTVITELIGNIEWIQFVKEIIPFGFFILIPALIVAGITGNKLAGKSKNTILLKKKKRMAVIAINGIVVLIPCAIYLRVLAISGSFNGTFLVIQCIEFSFGLLNIALLISNIILAKKLKTKKA